MKKLNKEELLDWLDDAHSSDCCDDAISREHSTTGQTPEYWSEKDKIRDQAYEQIKEIVKLFYSPLGHMTKYSPEEEWIRIK